MDEQQAPTEPIAPTVAYKDDDLVYVNPLTRTVVGPVEWTPAGKPKSLAMQEPVKEEADDEGAAPSKDGKEKKRRWRQRFYPWGTYRSMKRIYKIEGKQKAPESQKTLDEVLEKALQEPFWN